MFFQVRNITTLILSILAQAVVLAQPLTISSTIPGQAAFDVDINDDIIITFDQPIQQPTNTALYVYSNTTGLISGSLTVNSNILRFNPHSPFLNGDLVSVRLTTQIVSSVGGHPLATPLSMHFMVRSELPSTTPPLFKAFSLPTEDVIFRLEDIKPIDFDGDTDIDIVTPNLWLENDGSENFKSHVFASAHFPFVMQVYDVDNDHDMDVLVGTYDGILIRWNDGLMNFTSQFIPGTSIVTSISIADANYDGMPDILYADQLNGVGKNLAWMFSNGDGTFTNSVITSTEFIYKAIPVDLNNDKLIDIVATGREFIYWYRNDGSSFTRTTLVSTGNFHDRIYDGDLDGDMDVDLVVSDGHNVLHLENNGSGSFITKTLEGDQFLGNNATGVADVDGDGDLDVISHSSYYFGYYENNGSNTFTTRRIQDFGQNQTIGVPSDIDGDGDIDFACLLHHDAISWLKNTTRGEALPFEQASLGTILPEYTDAAAWADYDLDEDQDLLVIDNQYGEGKLKLYRNQAGSFDVVSEFSDIAGGSCLWFDFENDGDADILVSGVTISTQPWDNTATLIYINTNGTFQLLSTSTPLPGAYTGQVRTADLDNDGRDEILIPGTEGGIFSYHIDGFKKVYDFPYLSQEGRVGVDDIDLDGDIDIALTGWGGNDVVRTIFINHGAFEFTAMGNSFNGISGGTVILHDLDADRDPDLATIGPHANPNGSYAGSSFYKNDLGIFEKIERSETGAYIFADTEGAANVGDLNHDGYADIIVQRGSYYRGLELFYNDKQSWFDDSGYIFPPVTQRAEFVEIVDYDLDHDLDIMTGSMVVRNNIEIENQPPTPPLILNDSVRNNTLYTYWSGATDAETPIPGLTYQVYVGNTLASQDILSSNSNLATGSQFIQHFGTARGLWKIKIPTGGPVHWGVQTIDGGMRTSAFSAKKTANIIYIDGAARSCTAIQQKYKAYPSGDYQWSVKGGNVVSYTKDEIEIIWETEGHGSVGVTDGLHRNVLDVRVVNKPEPIINGDDIVCENSAGNAYFTTHIDDHRYAWTLDGGSFLRTPDSSKVYVRWSEHGPAKITIFETSKEDICTIENELVVDIKMRPSPIIKGPVDLCGNDAEHQYSIVYTPGNETEWSVFGGEIVDSKVETQIAVRWFSQAIGRVTVKETNEFCETTENLEVNLAILKYPNIVGALTVCDTEAMYTYASTDGYNYEWRVVNGNLMSASDESKISVKWDAEGVSKVFLTLSSGMCSTTDSVYVTVDEKPVQSIFITTSDNIFSAPVSTAYQWYLDNSPLDGITTQTLQPTDVGVYTVMITDQRGCMVTSAEMPFPITDVRSENRQLFNIYPNPADQNVIFELTNAYRGSLLISIYDVRGKVVFEEQADKVNEYFSNTFSLANLPDGLLVIHVKMKNLSFQQKLVVKHK